MKYENCKMRNGDGRAICWNASRAPCLLHFVLLIFAFAICYSAAIPAQATEPHRFSYDVIVYDATPAGIAAAVAAAKSDCDVLLIEPTSRIGGMITGGLSHPDFKTFEALTGAYVDLMHRVQSHYDREYGSESPQAKDCFRGTHAEPKVNLQIFHELLAEHPRVTLLHHHRVLTAEVIGEGDQQRIVSASFVESDSFAGPNSSADAEGKRQVFEASVFIDASYEGDLLAAAGVEYRVGREAQSQYGESFAPMEADDRVQGYNFRLVLTRQSDNLVLAEAPRGYDREMFTGVLPLMQSGQIKSVFARWRDCIYKAHTPMLPNGKYDINDVSSSPVRLSLPQINDAWPEGSEETRAKIHHQHVLHNVGLLYFLQNDAAVPKRFQDEARLWGFCRDEFIPWEHLSSELYVREGRRMQGKHVYTQNDTDQAKGDARAILHADSIAIGDYGHSCHGTGHVGPLFGGKHTGDFHHGRLPYQIPYGVLMPKHPTNLLVPTACSSSHVGFCALRLEPIWMNMGQAAGVAAGLAVKERIAVQSVPIEGIQQRLHQQGAATVYVSDVPPSHKDFAAVQWWGTLGGLHGIEQPVTGRRTGPEIRDHYDKAFLGHAAKLDEPLVDELRKRWLEIAQRLGIPTQPFADAETRGDFIRLVHEGYRQQQRHRTPMGTSAVTPPTDTR